MVAKADTFVKTYKTLTQIPTALRGIINSNGIISTVWSQRNFEKGKATIFQKDFYTNNQLKVVELPAIDVSSEQLTRLSPSEKYKAVIRDSDSKKFLEIWKNNSFLLRAVDLNAISDSNVHGAVYTDSEFSTFEWSPDETKILFLAEKKIPKSEPFYKRTQKDEVKIGSGDEEKPKGEEYVFAQDWGEQLVGKINTVIVQYDIEKDLVEIVKGIPEDVCAAQVRYSPDGTYLVGVAYDLEPRKLGLIYCSNRKSTIFKLDFQENYVALPLKNASVKNPIFSPDGKTVLWLQRKSGGPHASCMSLMKTSTPFTEKSDVETVINIVEDKVEISNGKLFYGLYCQATVQRPWASGNRLLISTIQKYKVVSYIINIDTGALTELPYDDGNFTVLDVFDDVILACHRNILKPDKLVIGKLTELGREQDIVWNDLTESDVVEGLGHCIYKYLDLETTGDVKSFNAIYIGPKTGNEKSVPLVVWPHGGPHSAFGNNFFLEGAMFLSFGYAILLVNFRGSLGCGNKSVEFLPGKIGTSDVADCIQATDTALNTFNWLNPNAVVLTGGSHGGFLVAHLSGQYPDKFKAVATRNPVIDVASMSIMSDIPDWCYVEAGEEYTQKGKIDDSILIAMRNASPIVHAHKVKAPTLLLIGSKDLRVPHFQGTEYYLRLKANGVKTRMNLYEDEHPLGKVPNEMDTIINTLLWFKEHLNI